MFWQAKGGGEEEAEGGRGGARWEGGREGGGVVEGNRRGLDSWFASRVHEKGLGKEKRETQLVRIKYLVVCEQFRMRGDCLIFATNHSMTEDLHGDRGWWWWWWGGAVCCSWDEMSPFLYLSNHTQNESRDRGLITPTTQWRGLQTESVFHDRVKF